MKHLIACAAMLLLLPGCVIHLHFDKDTSDLGAMIQRLPEAGGEQEDQTAAERPRVVEGPDMSRVIAKPKKIDQPKVGWSCGPGGCANGRCNDGRLGMWRPGKGEK